MMRRRKHRRRLRGRSRSSVNIGAIILISVTILSALIGSFLVVGNLLHDKLEGQGADDTSTNTEQTALNSEKAYVKSINGYSVLIEAADIPVISERFDSLIANEKNAASIPLNTKDGSILYNSLIAKELGIPVGSSNIEIEHVVTSAKEREVYLSGIYYVNAFSKDDTLVRSVELSKNASVIAEVLMAGFDEVVIIFSDISADNIDEAIRFIDSIKALTNNGAVGVAVPESILKLEEAAKKSEFINILSENADFLAIDTSNATDSDISAYIGEKINTEKLHLHMYKMRLLLPYSSDKQVQDGIISSAEENGISNWQIIIY